jgi:endo-1,4-beta-xylanase
LLTSVVKSTLYRLGRLCFRQALRHATVGTLVALAIQGCSSISTRKLDGGSSDRGPDAGLDSGADAGRSSLDASASSESGTGADSGAPSNADASATDASAKGCGVPTTFEWSATGPIISPMSDATHDLVAIKDPTVVFFNGLWNIYASTVGSGGNYNMAYLNFTDWSQASTAPQYHMDQTPGFGGYHAAPQLFYFTPQKLWYLVYQSGPPTYSTSADPTQPSTWTAPANFFASEPAIVMQNGGSLGWIDFWIICDTANCYLFFSDDNGHLYRSQTAIGDFPAGFDTPIIAMEDSTPSRLFEASNVYKMKGTGEYLLLVEAFDSSSAGRRYFRSWTADTLDGAWTSLQSEYATPFASAANVTFTGTPWTVDISHGEMLRDGYDETLEIDTCDLRYVYQGKDPSASESYNLLPWRLGLLTKTN